MTAEVEQLKRDLRKKFGDVVFNASDEKFELKRISTNIPSLDQLLDGGIALGRWTEIYGDESSLKTTIALKTMAEAQRLHLPVLYCDVERSITPGFLEHHGVDLSPGMLQVVQTKTGEQMVDVVREFLRDGTFKIIVIDSIAAMEPHREAEAEDIEKDQIGAQAKLISKMTRVLTSLMPHDVAVICINQTRNKISAYGDPTTTSGGKAMAFYAGQRIRLVSTKPKNKGKKRGEIETTTQEIYVELKKDKTSGQAGKQTVIHYDTRAQDIDYGGEIFNAAVGCGLVKRKGTRYTYKNKMMTIDEIKDMFRKKPKKYMKKVKRAQGN